MIFYYFTINVECFDRILLADKEYLCSTQVGCYVTKPVFELYSNGRSFVTINSLNSMQYVGIIFPSLKSIQTRYIFQNQFEIGRQPFSAKIVSEMVSIFKFKCSFFPKFQIDGFRIPLRDETLGEYLIRKQNDATTTF